MNSTKTRIKNKAMRIKVQTVLGTSVNITKKEAYKFLDQLTRRNVEPKIEFVEIGNGKELVFINA